jgi:hypothetical protein
MRASYGNKLVELPKLSADPASGNAGDQYYNTTLNKIRYYNGFAWKNVGSGDGSGTGDDLTALLFQASFKDSLSDLPTQAESSIDATAGKTDAALYDPVVPYFRLNYDASRTVTGTGTAMTISAAPAFTVKAGDVLVVGQEVRRITVVTTQTSYTVEAAFTVDPSTSNCNISQAVHTKDIYNFAPDGLGVSAAFGVSTFSEILVDYEDSSSLSDGIFDIGVAPVIAFVASHNGTSWTAPQTRPTDSFTRIDSTFLNAAGTALYLRFYANKTSGTGAVNLLKYKAFMQKATAESSGGVQEQAYCFTNGVGTEIQCSAPTLVGGKTTIQLNWQYPVGLNSGKPYGSLDVYLNGQLIPRFVDSTITPDASYTEYSNNAIQLDQDYSAQQLSVEVLMRTSIVDTSTTNTTDISVLREIQNSGFQDFVSSSQMLSATTVAGTPAAGKFYSSIINRASISDLSQDLKPRMGIERIMTQQVVEIQNEFGPNGERVFGVLNDTLGQIRFVGNWYSSQSAQGQLIESAITGDYVEITFYGTGLNILCRQSSAARDFRATVDNGAEGSNFYVLSSSDILTGRNYSPNQITNVVSSLSLGIHTVKIRNAHGSNNMYFHGFEILNESSQVKVNPGVSYVSGKKLSLSSQYSSAYSSGFESGTLGTRGGRVLVYQKADGTIGKAVTPTGSQANLASADHANEEVIRRFSPREFGAGRADDFSRLAASTLDCAFTLDDGTTTLLGRQVQYNILSNNLDALYCTPGATNFISLTFVGTGLDVVLNIDGTTRQFDSVHVNGGASIGAISKTLNTAPEIRKIVSGLPYGTHTVRFVGNVASSPFIAAFVVYGPKKPTLPSDAVELADYNIMADYVANATGGPDTIGTGTLRKFDTRELTYVGTWTATLATANMGGFMLYSTTDGDNARYTFFGTGFDWRFATAAIGANAATWQINVDGATNLSGFTTSSYGSGISTFTASTGTVVSNTTNSTCGISVSGLAMGLHTIRFTKISGTGAFSTQAIDIITPIHSPKSNFPADIQNTLSVGSLGISDNRKLTPVKDALPSGKAWAQAFGIAIAPTTSSAVNVPVPDMSCTIKTSGGHLNISYSVCAFNSNTNAVVNTQIYVDGVAQGRPQSMCTQVVFVNNGNTLSDNIIVPVAAGTHKVDVYWTVSGGGGTATSPLNFRTLLVEET